MTLHELPTLLLAALEPLAQEHDAARALHELDRLREQHAQLGTQIDTLRGALGLDQSPRATRLSIFHGYIPVLIVAFVVTLLATPFMRRLAVRFGVIDRPSEARKVHRAPVAYLGGVGVYLGLMAGILFSYIAAHQPDLLTAHATTHLNADGVPFFVPVSVLLGLTAIMLVGLFDDVTGISPRVKVGGQLLAAAALAIDDVGVRLAAGLLEPLGKLIGNPTMVWNIPVPASLGFFENGAIQIDLIYWAGTAIIALAVLGLCNASNLIDGLDGLLTGTTAIAAAGLLILALGMALVDDGPRDAQRIVLCLALLGACLGFLPHNFNPATIFLGDCGSLQLGFATCAIILTLGDTGKTFLVIAGLLVYAIPIIDMTLAVVRRKLAGKPLSAADDQHLHHMLKRSLGVKGAVFVIYAIAAVFATLGVSLSLGRARTIYVLAIVLAAFIGVAAIKSARRQLIEAQAAAYDARRRRPPPLSIAQPEPEATNPT